MPKCFHKIEGLASFFRKMNDCNESRHFKLHFLKKNPVLVIMILFCLFSISAGHLTIINYHDASNQNFKWITLHCSDNRVGYEIFGRKGEGTSSPPFFRG